MDSESKAPKFDDGLHKLSPNGGLYEALNL